MSSHRYLYENLILCRGYLVIPFQCGAFRGANLFSYQLLSAFERQGRYHKVVNPTELYENSVEAILGVAQNFLNRDSDLPIAPAYAQKQYLYQGNLVLISNMAGKFFYDHYSPDQLNNLAAPKLFESEADCIAWVKQGIDRLHDTSI
jgi:hypothetical protein